MKLFAFLFGFLAIAFLVAPRLAAGDPEPIGAEVGLLVFGILAATPCVACFGVSAFHRSVPAPGFLAAIIGALSSGAFYLVLAMDMPTLPVAATLALALASAIAIASGAPGLFRPMPGNANGPPSKG